MAKKNLEQQENLLDSVASRRGLNASWSSEVWAFGKGIVIIDNEDGYGDDAGNVVDTTFSIYRDRRRESNTGTGPGPNWDEGGNPEELIEELETGGNVSDLIARARKLAR